MRDFRSSQLGKVHEFISSRRGKIHDFISSRRGKVYDFICSQRGSAPVRLPEEYKWCRGTNGAACIQ